MTATAMTATNHDGHKPWQWWPQGRQWRPQTMTATNHDNDGHRVDNDGHSNDGHKPWQWWLQGSKWRPQTMSWFVAIAVKPQQIGMFSGTITVYSRFWVFLRYSWISCYYKIQDKTKLTAGPHRGPFVTQQISVLHIEHRIQSQPSFFITTIWHVGQYIASPFANIFCNAKKSEMILTETDHT